MFFLFHLPITTALVSLPTSMEVDIVFPRPNGRYAATNKFPLVIAIQNTAAAFEFGYEFSWDISSPDPNSLNFGGWGDIFVVEETSPPSADPYIQTNYTEALGLGEWVFSWTLSNARSCDSTAFSVYETLFSPISNGSFTFTVANDAPGPKFVGSCPSPVGVVSYSAVASYSVPGGYNICPVTATAPPSPNPCRVTINDAQASSISNALGLSVVVIPTPTTQTPSSMPSTSQKHSLSTTPSSSTPVGWTPSASTPTTTNLAVAKSPSMRLFFGLNLVVIIAMEV